MVAGEAAAWDITGGAFHRIDGHGQLGRDGARPVAHVEGKT